jgi:TIR domain
MRNVFISYRRVDPDQSLAKFLVEKLEANAQSFFWDNRITIGQECARIIDERIRKANFFVALVSADSMRSDMVREEIKLAHTVSRRIENPLKILPIRIPYLGDLPYDLRANLDPDPIRHLA